MMKLISKLINPGRAGFRSGSAIISEETMFRKAKEIFFDLVYGNQFNFPPDAFISGGSLHHIFHKGTLEDYDGDIDVFLPQISVARPSSKYGDFSTMSLSLKSIKKDAETKLQIIFCKEKTAEEVLGRFDFWHCVWYYDIRAKRLVTPTDPQFEAALQKSLLIPLNRKTIEHRLQADPYAYKYRLSKLIRFRGLKVSPELQEILDDNWIQI